MYLGNVIPGPSLSDRSPQLQFHTLHARTAFLQCAVGHTVQNTKPMPRISFSFKRLSAFSMCFEEIVTLLCSDIHHNVSTAEASGRFYFSDNDQLLFPVLKTKVEQMQRSSVFILTMQELHYIFAITSGHYLSTCPFFLIIL